MKDRRSARRTAHRRLLVAVAFGPALVVTSLVPERAARATACSELVQHRRPPKPFQPLPRLDPKTNRPYAPTDPVELPSKAPGGERATMPAKRFFDELDDLEEKLNALGYSLRDNGPVSLQELYVCRDVLERQADQALDATDPSSRPKKTDAEKKALLDAYLEAFRDGTPQMAELERLAKDTAVGVYLPPVPPYKPPSLTPPRPKRKDILKKRPWSFETGDKKTFWVKGEASIELEVKAADAVLRGRGSLFGATMGAWEGEVLGANAYARTLASDNAKANLQVRLVGKTIYDKTWEKNGLVLEETPFQGDVQKGVDVRFGLGPIPMRATVGFRGVAGLKMKAQLTPLQLYGGVVPFASARAYAQVAVDIGVAGAGVGGELVLAEANLPLAGALWLTWDEQPNVTLTLDGNASFTFLAGELYAFAYVNLLVARPELRYTLFRWDGFRRDINLFHTDWSWTPSGIKASGTLDANDVMEIGQVTAELRVAEAEQKAIDRASTILGGIAADATGPRARLVAETRARLAAQHEASLALLSHYERTLREGASAPSEGP